MKKLLALVLTVSTFAVLGQPLTPVATTKAPNAFLDAGVGVSVLTDNYFGDGDNSILSDNLIYFTKKVGNSTFSLVPLINVAQNKDNKSNARAEFQMVSLRWALPILNEAESGVKVSSQTRLYAYPEFDNNSINRFLGHGSVRQLLTVSKQLTSMFNLGTTVEYNQYVKQSGEESDRNNRARLYIDPTVNFTDSVSLDFQGIFARTASTRGGDVNTLQFWPTLSMGLSDAVTVDLYSVFNVASGENSVLQATNTKEVRNTGTYGLALTLNVL